ncbi:hypothetical protein [Methanobacterium sp.]|uniref:hypothetical protein n=1 Tax=Methanobacterium sp. TaxID=2164 RepID=UPI0031590E0B
MKAQELFTLIFAIHFTLIIDRVHRNYNPYDTYNAWKGQLHAIRRLLLSWAINAWKGQLHAIRRLLLSWAIMYILPLLNFAAFLIILGAYGVSFDPTPHGTLNIVLVGLSSFFDFGYYRIFEFEKISQNS